VEPYQTKAVEPSSAAGLGTQQLVVAPAPVMPPSCMAFTDAALRATRGVLCTSQHVEHNVTKSEWVCVCVGGWGGWVGGECGGWGGGG
jgi:hypothetical protein